MDLPTEGPTVPMRPSWDYQNALSRSNAAAVAIEGRGVLEVEEKPNLVFLTSHSIHKGVKRFIDISVSTSYLSCSVLR